MDKICQLLTRRLAAAMVLAAAVATSGLALAQNAWTPSRTVEIVVPSAPGGGLDVTGRAIQAVIQGEKLLKPATVVVNKPGAGTNAGVVYLNEHPGDGNYICIQAPPFLTNAIIGASKIDVEDVTPLALLLDEDIIFSVKADSRFASGKDVVKALLENPQSVTIGISSALGAHSHLAAALLMKAAGGDPRKLKVVVFSSGAEAATAVLGRHIDMAVTPASSILGHKEAGTLRVVGVPAEKRGAGKLADIPTWKEQGVDYSFSNWRIVLGPKGMPKEQVAFWDDLLGKVIGSPEWQKLTSANSWTPHYLPSSDARAFLVNQRKELKSVLADLGMAPRM